MRDLHEGRFGVWFWALGLGHFERSKRLAFVTMDSIAHHTGSAPTPNADDFFRPPQSCQALFTYVKKNLPILIGLFLFNPDIS
jgi:hypothetical protein